jgi:hypothetical protein
LQSLFESYLVDVMASLNFLWGKNIYLASKDEDGEEIVYFCNGPKAENVHLESRKDHITG